jgi:hypothetical protein
VCQVSRISSTIEFESLEPDRGMHSFSYFCTLLVLFFLGIMTHSVFLSLL